MRSWTTGRGAAALLVAVLAGAGCGKSSTPVTPGTCTGSIAELTLVVDTAIPSGAVIPVGIDTAATVFSIRVDSLAAPVMVGASALLVDRPALLRLTSGGDVTVRSGGVSQLMHVDTLCIAQLASDAYVYSTFTSAAGLNLPVPFDGSAYHRFTATGGEFPAFDDSVLSLPPVQILSPVANFAQDDTSTINVTWTPATSDTTVRVLCQLRDSTGTFVRSVEVADAAGSARILGTAVASLPSHSGVVLSVGRYRVARRTVGPTSRPLTLLCMVVDKRPILLSDPVPNLASARGAWRARVLAANADRRTNGARFLRVPAGDGRN